jgi:thioredoxin reductase (NADPH)
MTAPDPKRTSDLLVLGAGPAGLTAGLYAARSGHHTRLLERLAPGGQAATTWRVDNYPGAPRVNGADLMQAVEAQAREFGLEVASAEATTLVPGDELHRVDTPDGPYWASCVILALGAANQQVGVPGEEALRGRGVSYCATCDGAFFKDLPVAVIGGGNTALEEAEFLTRFASKVYLVHRREHFRADKTVQEQVLHLPKIEIVTPYVPQAVLGEETVTGLRIEHRADHSCRDLDVKGVFVFVGTRPNTAFLSSALTLDAKGYVPAGPDYATAIPGVYAAGDCRAGSVKQIVVAAGEGAAAAVFADRYLQTRHASQ